MEESSDRCNLCGSDGTRFIKESDDKYFHRRIVECTGCGLAYVSPQPTPEQLEELYARMYHADRKSLDDGTVTRFSDAERLGYRISRRLPRLGAYKSGGKLLDIGTNDGLFLINAKNAGYEVYGVEISPSAAELAARKSGAPVVSGALSDFIARYPDLRLDVVTLWDVIEHFTDPMAELKKIFGLLNPGGILALSTVNRGSLRGSVYKDRWLGFTESPEHIFFFTPTVMRRLIKKAGFTPLKVYGWMTAPVLLRFMDWFKKGNILEVYARKI